MRKLLEYRPSPAMALAFLALLAALSSSALALPGKRTVKADDLAKNAVTGKTVKNGSLRGADLKRNSVTGSDVNEQSLGKVPSASSADNATNAINAQQLGGTPADGYLRGFHDARATSDFDSVSPKVAIAKCDRGEKALGGGGSVAGGDVPENIVVQGTELRQIDIMRPEASIEVSGVETDPDGGAWLVSAWITCARGG